MTPYRRHRRHRRHPESGVTLVEVAVAMALGSIVLIAVGAIFVSLVGTVRTSTERSDKATNAQVARETIDRSLRAADTVPPVSDGTRTVLLDGRAAELTLTTGFYDTAAASALATVVDSRSSGSAWAAELRATGLVPRKVRYSLQPAGSACGTVSGIVEDVSPISNVTYSAAAQAFSVTWGAVNSRRCVLRTDLAPRFTYFGDCAGTLAVPAPLSATTLTGVEAVDYTLFPDTASETVGRVCLVNSS